MQNSEMQQLANTATRSNNLYKDLVLKINALINNNYAQLIQLLYTLDISEKKLKATLKDHPDRDAAVIITGLILERQVQKKESFSNTKWDDIPEEERW